MAWAWRGSRLTPLSTHGLVGYDVASTRRRSSVRIRVGVTLWAGTVGGEVAERSKALRQGRNLFGGVGSNPTLVTPFYAWHGGGQQSGAVVSAVGP